MSDWRTYSSNEHASIVSPRIVDSSDITDFGTFLRALDKANCTPGRGPQNLFGADMPILHGRSRAKYCIRSYGHPLSRSDTGGADSWRKRNRRIAAVVPLQ